MDVLDRAQRSEATAETVAAMALEFITSCPEPWDAIVALLNKAAHSDDFSPKCRKVLADAHAMLAK